MRLKRFASLLITCVFIALPFFVLAKRQYIYDWWVLRSYAAPAAVEKLANDTTMTEKARTIFYVAKPEIKSKEEFRGACVSAEKTIVLGCYKTRDGIYVYDVTDDRLAGVQQVTAAHEMLHAAYERLGRAERERVNKLTNEAYDSLQDERIRKNVEAYRKRDAGVVPNELHSILGTEVGALSSELEAYYKQYFSDRAKIVGYSVQYESEFSNREDQVEAYDAQLKQLKTQIDELNSSLTAQALAIDKKSTELDQLLAEKKISEYNSGIPAYKKLISNYNNDVTKLKTAITSYNSVVAARNAVVATEQELYNAIDTRVPEAK